MAVQYAEASCGVTLPVFKLTIPAGVFSRNGSALSLSPGISSSGFDSVTNASMRCLLRVLTAKARYLSACVSAAFASASAAASPDAWMLLSMIRASIN